MSADLGEGQSDVNARNSRIEFVTPASNGRKS
jgi:hypothetical protein